MLQSLGDHFGLHLQGVCAAKLQQGGTEQGGVVRKKLGVAMGECLLIKTLRTRKNSA